ncbi:DEAD/DEAH box helicase [Propionicimonas sp.]|uniref:DEAD/DEAH box helicase n=1 Tax=Propionicimonas sp. TaxID=1955623 RepID=UPI00183AFA31|nr:DEAD/DEAH box helicase [Propionicimonas sp.]MBU3977186.1 DEAD/DEAH box helicase [Actinomycetota bacterium]MBA3021112.1 DEAD/DEAH box helicase [Propionicimonas sp.]MBU3985696.1 DEAD/DEAH box helicase [Actinomycetota bacterium]MBU4008481.1 DEAD/DEAH box helicase [Actinomycetota bacterium]MBU4066369.1 DEAD/DEAH box helicase [Actinomycetota bacterium]
MTAVADFAAGYPFALDDYQVTACERLAAGSGVLVAAPTGAGKTVVGEFAVFLALQRQRKCFYTTPIKALSNQKYHDLCARHGEEAVGLLTGDTSINAEAQVVVMTTEVLRNMIYAGSPTLGGLGFVVMDEVHYLADRSRGAVWEEVIISLADSVQVVALSATVSNAEEFGDWLDEVRGGVEVVVTERRPVPLYQHVMVGRRLLELFAGKDVNPELLRIAKEESRTQRDDSRRPRGRSGNGRRDVSYGSGRYGGAAARSKMDASRHLMPRRDATIERLAAEGLLPAIFFIFSRLGCDTAVGQLMNSGLRLTDAHERAQLAEIAARHTASLSPLDLVALDYDSFVAAFTAGIAAHHAGLLPAFKEAVEEGFVSGLVKVVFATETLALGINMPARSVVLEKLVKYNGETHADITAGEFTQLTGRAGRRGIDVEGHAVVCWQPGLDPRAVAGLASRRTYPLRSSFAPTYNMAVNLVGTVGRERARGLLEQSFAQFQSDRSVVGLARSMAHNRTRITEDWAQASCELGEAEAYFRLRSRISAVEAEAARLRRSDRRAEALTALAALQVGDIIDIPGKRHRGWAVVVELGRAGGGPTVLTVDRQVKQLSIVDFPEPPTTAGRVKVPKHFDLRSPASRRNLAVALRQRIDDGSLAAPVAPAAADADAMARVTELRAELRRHPVHACPDRETHARYAESALRAERDNDGINAQAERRTNTIAVRFDRICSVLESLGYLSPDGGKQVTEAGRMLSRLYSELDLVTAEAIRSGVFDNLSAPQLAAVLSSLVFEARGDRREPARMPDRASEDAQIRLRKVWREVCLTERDHRLPSHAEPEIGFAESIHAWVGGAELADVLNMSNLTAGDFVRWARQVIDAAGQVADAAGAGPLRGMAKEVVYRARRGVVDAAPLED